MKLDLDKSSGNFIRGFAGGQVLVGSEVFSSPVIITIDRIIADWSPPDVGQLSLADFTRVLELEPEVILLGTGERQRFPPLALTTAILSQGIGIEVMTTAAACRTFNVLASEFRKVAAVLFMA